MATTKLGTESLKFLVRERPAGVSPVYTVVKGEKMYRVTTERPEMPAKGQAWRIDEVHATFPPEAVNSTPYPTAKAAAAALAVMVIR